MKILFWIPYPKEGASNRYRIEQYLPYLKKESIEFALRSFWISSAYRILYVRGRYFQKSCYFILGTISRIVDLLNIHRYDLIIIHRESYPIGGAIFESILHLLKKPFIFDFDDAIFFPSNSRINNFIEKFKCPGKIAVIIKLSKAVIAGNSYLAEFALNHNRNVFIVPTAIDTSKYRLRQKTHEDSITVGWMGSVTTAEFLYMIEGVFVRLSKRFKNVGFKMVGGDDIRIPGLTNITSKPWSLNAEMEDLASFDIAIMPMPDNEWTKGKCGFKAILYMSMGIPCVCSAVGVNKEIIHDGVNGFLAKTEEEWVDKLSRLITDERLRIKLGETGRRTVENCYSLAVNAPKFIEIIKKLA